MPHAEGPSLASRRLKGGELEDTNRANLQMNGKLPTVAKTMKENKNGGVAAQNDRGLLPPQWLREGSPRTGHLDQDTDEEQESAKEARGQTCAVEEKLVPRPWGRRECGALEMLKEARVGRKQEEAGGVLGR